jgi:hypothetical protein
MTDEGEGDPDANVQRVLRGAPVLNFPLAAPPLGSFAARAAGSRWRTRGVRLGLRVILLRGEAPIASAMPGRRLRRPPKRAMKGATKNGEIAIQRLEVVGAAGFEPATPAV